MPKYELRFFFDAGTRICVWAGNDAARDRFDYPIPASQLPVSASLADDIDQLTIEYDTFIDWDYPPGPSPRSRDDWVRFNEKVGRILSRLAEELGTDFQIHDERNLDWSAD